MLELYKNIRDRRIALNMTQAELAQKMGYADKSMIAKIEKGQVDLPQSKIVSFAKALGVLPRDLMGWSDSHMEAAYYNDPETARIAQQIFENRGMRTLFDAAADSRPEDLQMAADLLKRLKGTNPDA